jgi:hypothetical protein
MQIKVVAVIYEGDEKTPVCPTTFGEAVASVEVTRRYFCSHKTDYASMSRTGKFGERDSYFSFIMPDQHNRCHSSVILKSNIPGIHACNSLYICTSLCSVSLF